MSAVGTTSWFFVPISTCSVFMELQQMTAGNTRLLTPWTRQR
jgi:hypothetical protein